MIFFEITHLFLSSTKATDNSNSSIKRSWTTYTCPLTRPNVFGIKSEHNIRLDCDGTSFLKYHLSSHFENYHRMLPECAARLKNAIINGELSHETKLFDEHEIIYVNNDILYVIVFNAISYV